MRDSVLKKKVKYYFDSQTRADLSRVRVSVVNGEVFLEGYVPTKFEKDFAENILKKMWEVARFTSNLNLLSEAQTLKLPPLWTILQTT